MRSILTGRQARAASRLLQVAIAGILVVGLGTRNLSVVVNSVVALWVTFLPAVLARDFDIQIDANLALLLTTTLFLHTAGMLGLYAGVWWYDHVTHTLSAMLVAGVGYTATRAVDEHSDAIYLPADFLVVYIILFTLAAGVFWEVLEFLARELAVGLRFDPVLVQYGLDDTLADLLFDIVGALVVAVFGTRWFEALVDRVAIRLGSS